MGVLEFILGELDEMYIIKHVTKRHDEARNIYQNRNMTVRDDDEFGDMVADYYNYHFSKCVARSAKLSRSEATGRAKEIIENAYKIRGSDILKAYYDGKHGTDGGMYKILDLISDTLKEESVKRHIRDVLDRHIQPSNFKEKVSIILEIFNKIGSRVPGIDYATPERYAHNYEQLVLAISEHYKTQSMIFRRL